MHVQNITKHAMCETAFILGDEWLSCSYEFNKQTKEHLHQAIKRSTRQTLMEFACHFLALRYWQVFFTCCCCCCCCYYYYYYYYYCYYYYYYDNNDDDHHRHWRRRHHMLAAGTTCLNCRFLKGGGGAYLPFFANSFKFCSLKLHHMCLIARFFLMWSHNTTVYLRDIEFNIFTTVSGSMLSCPWVP